MSIAMTRVATQTASTWRIQTDPVSGRRGESALYLSDLRCTPLDPVDPETRARLVLDTPHELRVTYVVGTHDIKKGDVLVVDRLEYPIAVVADWSDRNPFMMLVVERLD